jgi:hypothetical protein
MFGFIWLIKGLFYIYVKFDEFSIDLIKDIII